MRCELEQPLAGCALAPHLESLELQDALRGGCAASWCAGAGASLESLEDVVLEQSHATRGAI
jgi:hypothetical protein